jgi:hypothetical protein
VGTPELLRAHNFQEVDWAILESVAPVLPQRKVAMPDEWEHPLLDVYEDWLRFAIAIYEQAETSRRQRGGYLRIPDGWTRVFFSRLSERLLNLDAQSALHRFLEPILATWERAPELMETFMRALLMEASANGASAAAFVPLWKQIGMTILSADIVRERRFRHDRHVEGILAILVFGDPLTTWRTDTFEPVERCADLITQWCRAVGELPACFRALTRLLSSVGSRLVVRHGVAWLAICLDNDDVAAALFAEYDIAQALAALLVKTYRYHSRALRSSDESWRRFNVIVDQLVSAGEPAAASLQARVRSRR